MESSTATDNIFAQRKQRTNLVTSFRRRFQKQSPPPPPQNKKQQQPPQQLHDQLFFTPTTELLAPPVPFQRSSSRVLGSTTPPDDAWATAARRGGGYLPANAKRASVAPARAQQYQQRSVHTASVADSLYSVIAVPDDEYRAAAVAANVDDEPQYYSRRRSRRRRSGAIYSISSSVSSTFNATASRRISVAPRSDSRVWSSVGSAAYPNDEAAAAAQSRPQHHHERTRSLEQLLNELDVLRNAGQDAHPQHYQPQQQQPSISSTPVSRYHKITALATQSSQVVHNRREVVIVTSPMKHAPQTPILASLPETMTTSSSSSSSSTSGAAGTAPAVIDATRNSDGGEEWEDVQDEKDKSHQADDGKASGWYTALGELWGSAAAAAATRKPTAMLSPCTPDCDSSRVPQTTPPSQRRKAVIARHSFTSAARAAVAAPSTATAELKTPRPISKSPSKLEAVKAAHARQHGPTRLSVQAATNSSIATALPATSVSLPLSNQLRVVRVCRGPTVTGSMLRGGGRARTARTTPAGKRRGSGDSGFEDGLEERVADSNGHDEGDDDEDEDNDDDEAWEDLKWDDHVWAGTPQLQLADVAPRRRTIRRSVVPAPNAVGAAQLPARSPFRRLFRVR
ncbi:hypothetical protein HDU86_000337 [Geranomyces michiganensis]|nr:hypothetical protein HDU86_000337 [Geranomyces michiganensis]